MNHPAPRRCECRPATEDDLARVWNRNIADNPGDVRWADWKREYIELQPKRKSGAFDPPEQAEPSPPPVRRPAFFAPPA